MSTISNGSFIGGETLNTTDINNKFQDITNATTAGLNADNIRDQSVDLSQMDSQNLNGKSGIQLVALKSGSVGTANTTTDFRTYTLVRTGTPLLDAGGSATNLPLGGGITLSTNDMLRVYYSGRCETTTTVLISDTKDESNAAWAFWLQWDITDNTLSNFTEVPNQGNWNNQIAGGRYAEPTDVVISSTHGIASTAVVPHFFVRTGSTKTRFEYDKNNVNGSYYYKNTGGNVTVYGLRIVVGGIYRGIWHQNATGTARRNYLEHTTDTAYRKDTDTIKVYNMQLSALFQRTD